MHARLLTSIVGLLTTTAGKKLGFLEKVFRSLDFQFLKVFLAI